VIYESLAYLGRPLRTDAYSRPNSSTTAYLSRFWFDDEHGNGGYYNRRRQECPKAFLRSPLEFSRITSGFSSAACIDPASDARPSGDRLRCPVGRESRQPAMLVNSSAPCGYGKVVIVRHRRSTNAVRHLSGLPPAARRQPRASRRRHRLCRCHRSGHRPHLHYEFALPASTAIRWQFRCPIARPWPPPNYRLPPAAATGLCRLSRIGGTDLALSRVQRDISSV